MGLTDRSIKNLKSRAARYEEPDGHGLYVVVEPKGHKAFVVRYRHNGKSRKLSIGTFGPVSLAAAREQAATAMRRVADGYDPAVEKQARKQAQRIVQEDTFEAVARRYFKLETGMVQTESGIEFHGKMRTAKRRYDDAKRLLFPVLGKRPIHEIKRSEIVRLLDKVHEENGITMADRMLGQVNVICNWHAARSDDFKSPIVRKMRRTKISERARKRILTDDEIRAVWHSPSNDSFLPFVKFLLLTGARRNEAAQMTWDELQGDLWILPAARNKTKLDLERTLSDAAMAIIEAQPRTSKFVFPAARGGMINSFSEPKAALDATSKTSDWTLHDSRRTARSLMSRAGVNTDHAERCLGHVIGGIRGTYDRHEYSEEKRFAYTQLAGLIERIIEPPKGNVAQLKKQSSRR